MPPPSPPGWVDAWLQPLRAAKPSCAALQSSAHELVRWDTLLAEGLTCDALLRCDPRAVVAWVRTADDGGVTLAHMRTMPGGASLTARALLDAWGAHFTTPLLRRLRINATSLEELGLDGTAVARMDWTPARWRELFGAVPVPEAVLEAQRRPQAPQPMQREPEPQRKPPQPNVPRVLRL